jgi:hypothetical protein
MGSSSTLKISGSDPSQKRIYQAIFNGKKSSHQRHFCGNCGSYLYAFDERWSENVYPFASSIDSPDLPSVPTNMQSHIMMEFKTPFIHVPENSQKFSHYPECGIKEWHEKNLPHLKSQ